MHSDQVPTFASDGSPFEQEDVSYYYWSKDTPTEVTVEAFQWEAISADWAPVPGLPHGLTVTPDYIIAPLPKQSCWSTTNDQVAFVDRLTMEVTTYTVGNGPRAVALSDIVLPVPAE